MTAHETVRAAITREQTTQKDIAQRLGISEQYLSDICTGRRAISAFVAVRLQRVLGLEASRLYYQQAMEELEKARREYKPLSNE
jgi:plasmid maintenance system antidote protein VapI